MDRNKKYGAKANRVKFNVKLDPEKIKKLIQRYYGSYPNLATWPKGAKIK